MSEVTVIKCDPAGNEIWRWSGKVLERSKGKLVLEARFNLQEHSLGDMVLRLDDRLVETYYADRWYNIYEVCDRADDSLKGWYCNLSLPAELGEQIISYRDLALDLIVHPDGRQEVLDEDEFDALDISAEVRNKALEAWGELRELFRQKFEE